MVYNLTAIAINSTGLLPFMQGVNNELMNGTLGLLMLIGITAVIFMGFYFVTQDITVSVASSAWIAFGLSIFLRAMDLLANKALFITLIGAAIAIAFSFKK